MKIFDRHIFGGVFWGTLCGVFVISFALVLGNVIRELMDLMVNQNLPLISVLFFLWLALPFTLSFTIPWALLTAVLLVFGRLSANNELIALQTAGVSLLRICLPALVFAGILAGFCMWLNVDVNPKARQRMLNEISHLATKNPMTLFREDEVITTFADRRISIGATEGNLIKNLVIFEVNREGIPSRMISAKEAEVSRDPQTFELLIHMRKVRIEERDKGSPFDLSKVRNGILIEEVTYPLSMQKVLLMGDRKRSLAGKTFAELTEFLASGAEGNPLPARVEYHRRFSLSFACLAFAFVGIPLGITAHRKETSVGIALSLVLAFAYLLVITYARVLSQTPVAQPILIMWLPNLIFLGLGGYLFRRLYRL
ncbi:MAG: LptF/LptG family permease [Terrimicrobiaceae bacterium]